MILFRGAEQITDIAALENSYLEKGEVQKLLVVVPTNRHVRSRMRELIRTFPGKVSGPIQIETYATLVQKLYRLLPEKAVFIGSVQGLYLLKGVLRSSNLFYSASGKREISGSLLEGMHYAITEYMRYNVQFEDLEENLTESGLTNALRKKAEDFAAAYIRYYEVLKQKKLTDDSLASVTMSALDQAQFTQIFRYIYPQVETVIITGFTEFANPEIDLFTKISTVGGIYVTISLDYYVQNVNLFGGIKSTADQLKTAGFIEAEEMQLEDKNPFGRAMRKRFSSDFAWQKEEAFLGSISIHEAESPVKEISDIANLIANLLYAGSCKPGDICVAINDVTSYAGMIRNSFSKYSIPLNLTDRYRLNSVPMLNYLVSLFTIEGGDYYYTDVARIISSGILNTWMTVSDFYKIAEELRVTRGYTAWLKSISRKKQHWGAAGKDESKLRKLLSLAEELENSLKQIREWHTAFRTSLTAAEFRQKFIAFTNKTGFRKKVLTTAGDAEKVITAFEYFFDELFATLDLFISEQPDDSCEPSFYRDLVQSIVRTTRFNTREEPDAQVLVTTPEEIRGLSFKVLIIAGLYDGNFPLPYKKKLFFGKEIPGDERLHSNTQAFSFYQTLCSWRERLILTYPRRGERGEYSQSIFLREFLAQFAVQKLDLVKETPVILSKFQAAAKNARVIYDLWNSGISTAGNTELEKKVALHRKRILENEQAENYNGIMPHEMISEGKLQPRISVTALESYAKCPQMYYYQYILNLREQEEPEDGINAIELGNLLHEVFWEYYTVKAGQAVSLADDYHIIRKIAERVFENINFDSPLTLHDRLRIFGRSDEDKETVLYAFLEQEAVESVFRPILFEQTFTAKLKTGKPLDKEFVLSGKIDRIEINDALKLFAVTDYKTGSTLPTAAAMNNGKSLQLPLYLSVTGDILREQGFGDYLPGEMYVYKISKGDASVEKKQIRDASNSRKKYSNPEHIKPLMDLQANMINKNREFILNYTESIYEGRFELIKNYNPTAAPCSYCAYHDICRVKERKDNMDLEEEN